MTHTASRISRRNAVEAALAGAPIAQTARAAGVATATLYRWLKVFDPDHPVASSRPQKRGPKGPRRPEALAVVIEIIERDPDLWGRHRVAMALAERGIALSEATVSRILPIARAQIGEQRDRKVRTSRREMAARLRHEQRREERDARREADVRLWLDQNITPDITPEEAFQRIGRTLSETGWRIRVKDLTPTLRSLADAYRRAACEQLDLPEQDKWQRNSYRVRNQDHARVAALNHWAKRWRRRPPDPGSTSDRLLPKLALSTELG